MLVTILIIFLSREKSRYDDRGHHPDYYDRRLGRDQMERTINSSINNTRSDENRGGGYPASENLRGSLVIRFQDLLDQQKKMYLVHRS